MPDLRGAKLFQIDLRGAILSGAILSGADLSLADLSEANLSGADLLEANLINADLRGAKLSYTNLSVVDLQGADFTDVICGSTTFANVDLSTVKGLETIQHITPSTLSIDTLYKSQGKIPAVFLRGCRVPENFLSYIPLLIEGKDFKILLEEARMAAIKNSIFGAPISTRKLQCDVFMVMPFAPQFQPIYDDHIKSVVEGLGQTIKRGDDFFGKTSIMVDVWSAINNAKLIIAECTGRNPNVFYELGIAHSLDKAVIMITQSIDDIPFDIRHMRVIKYEYNPRGMREFEAKLKTAVTNLLEE